MYKYEYFHYTRKNKKISLEKLATHLGVSISFLSLVEKGERRLSYDMAVKLASYLNKSPDELFLDDHQYFLKNNEKN